MKQWHRLTPVQGQFRQGQFRQGQFRPVRVAYMLQQTNLSRSDHIQHGNAGTDCKDDFLCR
jgi:hypothetical protein